VNYINGGDLLYGVSGLEQVNTVFTNQPQNHPNLFQSIDSVLNTQGLSA